MSELCKQCAELTWGPGTPSDFAGMYPDQIVQVLCEGCGEVHVNNAGIPLVLKPDSCKRKRWRPRTLEERATAVRQVLDRLGCPVPRVDAAPVVPYHIPIKSVMITPPDSWETLDPAAFEQMVKGAREAVAAGIPPFTAKVMGARQSIMDEMADIFIKRHMTENPDVILRALREYLEQGGAMEPVISLHKGLGKLINPAAAMRRLFTLQDAHVLPGRDKAVRDLEWTQRHFNCSTYFPRPIKVIAIENTPDEIILTYIWAEE